MLLLSLFGDKKYCTQIYSSLQSLFCSNTAYIPTPFVEMVAVKHKSKNRPKGTIETKPITFVTKEVITKMIIDKVFPAICKTMPVHHKSAPVYVQQDNVKPLTAGLDPIHLD